jgi:hypothetical protein
MFAVALDLIKFNIRLSILILSAMVLNESIRTDKVSIKTKNVVIVYIPVNQVSFRDHLTTHHCYLWPFFLFL